MTSDQPEGLEHIQTRQLSMKVGPQWCLFLCSIEQTVKEICTFQMGGFPVQIPLSVFWNQSSPKVIYKINIASISILRNFYIRIRVYLDTSETIVNAGGVNKRPSQAFGNIIINSVSNSSFTTVHEIPAETTNLQPLFEKRLQQQSSSRYTL